MLKEKLSYYKVSTDISTFDTVSIIVRAYNFTDAKQQASYCDTRFLSVNRLTVKLYGSKKHIKSTNEGIKIYNRKNK